MASNYNLRGAPTLEQPVEDFSGGLNVNDASTIIQDNQASDLLNMSITTKGRIKKRPGLKIEYAYPNNEEVGNQAFQCERFQRWDGVNILFSFFEKTPTSGEIIMVDNVGRYLLQLFNADGSLFTSTGGFKIEERKTQYFSCFQMNNKFYFGNATNGYFRYDGADESGLVHMATKVDGIPHCDYSIVHNNRVFYAGFLDMPDQMFFSQLANPENVSMNVYSTADEDKDSELLTTTGGGGVIRLPNPAGEITGLEVFLGSLLIFKRDSIHTLHGTTPNIDFVLEQLNTSLGCVAPRSITRGNNFVFYLSNNGVQFIRSPHEEYTEFVPISTNINPELENVNLKECSGVYFGGEYYLFTPNYTYVLNELLGCWMKHDYVFNSARYDEVLDEIIFAGKNGYFYKLVEGQLKDEVSPNEYVGIKGVYSTKNYGLGAGHKTKRLKWLKMFFKPNPNKGTIKIKWEMDYKDDYDEIDISYKPFVWGVSKWGDGSWGNPPDQQDAKININGVGGFCRLTFSNDEIDVDMNIYGFVLGFKQKRKVR